MGRPLPTDWLEVAPEVDVIPLQPFGTPPAPRTINLNDWLATNAPATRQSAAPSSPPTPPTPPTPPSPPSPPPSQEWRRHAYLADRALEISRRVVDVRAQGNGAVLGMSDLSDARASETRTADEHDPVPRGPRSAYPTLSERAAEQLGLALAPRRAHAPVPVASQVPAVAGLLGPTSSFSPPSPRPRHRTTSPPTPSAPLSTTDPPPAPREALIPLPPVRSTHSPPSREPTVYLFGQSTAEPGSTLFAAPVPAPSAEQRQASISEASLQLSSRVDRLASFRDRIAASSAAGRLGERDAILRNARNALDTAVRFAERLEQATRELSRISDTTSTDLAPPPSSSAAPRTSTPPPADRRLPSTSLSLQRSIDQLRAASARIDRVLDQHLTPSERLRPPEPAPASSPRTSRSAFRPPLTALPIQPSLSPYRPFSLRESAPGQPLSGVHRGGMGLSSGLMMPAAQRRRTTTAAAELTDEESEGEAEYPRRRQNEDGSWVKLDRNGDAIDDNVAREKEARPHRITELIGR